jgi:hypothetical protein
VNVLKAMFLLITEAFSVETCLLLAQINELNGFVAYSLSLEMVKAS